MSKMLPEAVQKPIYVGFPAQILENLCKSRHSLCEIGVSEPSARTVESNQRTKLPTGETTNQWRCSSHIDIPIMPLQNNRTGTKANLVIVVLAVSN
jgi:hypothetical protein